MQWQIREEHCEEQSGIFWSVYGTGADIQLYMETLIPINFGIRVKLGLANLVIVIALYKMKLTEGYICCLWSECYCQDSYLEIISVSFTAWPVDC